MSKLVIGNWKMNGSAALIDDFSRHEKLKTLDGVETVVCPPMILLERAVSTLSSVAIGAQDCGHMHSGAFTGDTSAKMIKQAGASYVLLGHSERRRYQQETNDTCVSKVICAQQAGLRPVFCIGERIEHYEANMTIDILVVQLESLIAHGIDFSNLVIAYEPIWSIGTGLTPSLGSIENTMTQIRKWLLSEVGLVAANTVPVLYGGSVNAKNAKDILSLNAVGGVLVGGASLDVEEFYNIASAVRI